jgi:hypothetical protein
MQLGPSATAAASAHSLTGDVVIWGYVAAPSRMPLALAASAMSSEPLTSMAFDLPLARAAVDELVLAGAG